jgi:protein-S-isoprenylcysteine O-methyltransferase Ste14
MEGKQLVSKAQDSILSVVKWYCLGQAILTIVWWCGLWMSPSARGHFWPADWPADSLDAFILGDSIVVVLGGVVAAALASIKHPGLRPILWLIVGGLVYATSLCCAVAMATGKGVMGATAMTFATIGFIHLSMAEILSDRPKMSVLFRSARSAHVKRHRMVTAMQLVMMWHLILALFPSILWRLESAMGLPQFQSTVSVVVGGVLFAIASAFNLYCAWTMTKSGDGTPFPYDKTNRLVVDGPYRWIRNPMAVTGLAQGTAVGIAMGSPLVLLYVVCGGLIWQCLVRPVEEQMMEEQFGEQYAKYKRDVPCWLPIRSR